MRIVLINPPVRMEGEFKDWKGKLEIYQPLGLQYIAAVLKKAGHEAIILDAIIEDYKNTGDKWWGLRHTEIAKRVKEIRAESIGIGGMATMQDSIIKTADEIKQVADITIFVGGPYASIKYEDCKKNRSIDYIIVGEAENSIGKFVENFQKGVSIDRVIFSERTKNLNDLPFPDRQNIDKYFKAARIYRYARGRQKTSRTVSIISSRGGPFNCIFCAAKIAVGSIWRPRTVDNIISEMEECIESYNVTDFYFEDENMSLSKERMNNLMDVIISKRWKIRLHSNQGLRADTLDFDLLKKMKRAGYDDIAVAPETGSQKTMDKIIEKKLNLKNVEEVVANCKKIGLDVACFFVLGFPDETKEDIEETLAFMKKIRSMGAFHCTVRNAIPVPNTRLYNESKARGLLIKDGENLEKVMYITNKHMLNSPNWTPEEIECYVARAKKEDLGDIKRG